MHKSNEILLHSALLRGNKEELLEIYEKIYYDYVKLVYFSVSKYINDDETIKDITNEVFVAFFNNSSNVKDSIKYYLMRITRNLCVKYLEKENKITKWEDINNLGVSYEFESHKRYVELVEDLKNVLTQEEVNIILWHVVDGYTFKEIGDYLNLKNKTVNKMYERAIKKYRLKKEGV